MIARAQELFGEGSRESMEQEPDAQWFAGKHKFIWPGIRSLELLSVPNDIDVRKYKGRPHDHVLFDELSEFTHYIYSFLGIWARSSVPGQRVFVGGATNPPTVLEGRWVIDHWAPWLSARHPNRAQAGELRWFATIDGEDTEVENSHPFTDRGEKIIPASRTFIPAKVDDNPVYMATGYKAQLQKLTGVLRNAYLLGDFLAAMSDDAMQLIPSAWLDAAFDRWRARKAGAEMPRLDWLGVDVAHGGRDRSVFFRRYGNVLPKPIVLPGKDTPTATSIAAVVVPIVTGEGGQCAVDATDRWGAGAVDVAEALMQNAQLRGRIHGVNFGQRTDARDKTRLLSFRNVRAFAFWSLMEALNPESGDDLAIEPFPGLAEELLAFRYEVTPGGILIEDKDAIKKRIRRSPDLADAAALTYATSPFGNAKDVGWLMLSAQKKAEKERKALEAERARAGR